MLKRLTILLLIFLESGILFAGNPVMIVRCGRPGLADASDVSSTDCDELGNYVSYEGHCYAIPEDGSCPNYPESMVLVPMEVEIDGETTSICVPDCSSTCGERCPTAPIWYGDILRCGCEEVDVGTRLADAIDFTCDCPFFLELPEDSKLPGVAIVRPRPECVAPQKTCYEAGISFTIDPYICDGPESALDTIRIVIKGAGGSDLGEFDALTISQLENCDLLDGTEALLELAGLFSEDSEAAFVANSEGCIVVEFTRQPNAETNIVLAGGVAGADTTITIPACPRAFDPCSCTSPHNVTEADGTVLFWYDELTVIGTAGTPVILKNNAISAGFLDTTQMMVANGANLGVVELSGSLTVPFLRTPGVLTDIEVTQTIGGIERSTTLMSGCAIAVDACLVNLVPTMGQWAITILGLLMLIIGVVSFSVRRLKTT